MMRTAGVTIIELLIVMAIALILLSLSVPSFITYTQERKLIGAAENLFDALKYARSSAIRTKNIVIFSVNSGNAWCYGANTLTACNCSVTGACNLGIITTLTNSNLSLSSSGLNGSSVQFEPLHGYANVTNAFVTLTIIGKSKSISANIKQSGVISLCSSTVSGYSACS